MHFAQVSMAQQANVELAGIQRRLAATYPEVDKDAVPSAEFRQRTIVQSGRTVLASASVSF